ncbi:MAG: hypothetical protein VX498_15755, partial [Myxococcota bacterium]|nr:hypothetical protein [Myxococcota bacterium]
MRCLASNRPRHRISVLPPILCFTYALAAGAWGGGEAPPNPLALTEEEQPSAASQPTEGGDSGGAQGP